MPGSDEILAFQQASELLRAGRLEEALARYDEAIALKPDYADAYNNRGVVLSQMKRFDDALASYGEAIALAPDHSNAFTNRGVVQKELGRYEEALASFEKAVALAPGNANAFYDRGTVFQELKRFEDALRCYDMALALNPGYADAHNNRGVVLQEFDRFEEALASFNEAVARNPYHADAHNNRGVALQDLNRFEEALAAYERAIALNSNHANAHNNRGKVLRELRRFADALASYDRAAALNPKDANIANNRANALQELKRFDEAIACYDRAIALKPDFTDAIMNRGIAKLLTGRYAEGWADYESRWMTKMLKDRRPALAAPPWQGEDVSGRAIAVYAEQGLGDTIQFARYLPLLAGQGAKVTLLAPRALHRLLRTLGEAIELATAVEPSRPFDFSCALMSLPFRFGTDETSMPRDIPYLRADAERAAMWKARLGTEGFKIGIVWQGNPDGMIDRGRSMPLREFLPLARIKGVRLISLQKNYGLDQLQALPPGMAVETLGEDFDGGPDAFLDTAAVVENLDLVITADTSMAHVAGALGRPVWVALKYVPDWRWLLDREDSPWYPTARLFRQRIDGGWRSVFSRMAKDLNRILGHDELSWDAASVRVVPAPDSDAVRVFEDALSLYRAGRIEQALAGYDEAIALKPDYPDAFNNRAVALCELKRFDEALASCDKAIALRPDHPAAFNNRGNALQQLGRFAEALASYDTSIALKPEQPEAFNNRGVVLQELNRFEDALASYERAIALRPHYAEAFYNLALVLSGKDHFDEAMKCFDRAIALKPDYVDALMNRGIGKLLTGRYAEGWADYEWRWKTGKHKDRRPSIAAPPWQGESLAGRAIAIYAEQGLGDTIQFARYLPLLLRAGAKVTLLAPRALHRLLRILGEDIELATSVDPSRPFDFECALMSLPFRFRTDQSSIPRDIPYLLAEEERVAMWKARIGTHGFKIGIAWQGNPDGAVDRGRSIPLRAFAPLAGVEGVRLISLQKNYGLDQLKNLPSDMAVETLGREFDGGPDAFLDTAAVMTNLDLVITADTSIAHLAGALGRPVWIALKYVPDWRWLLDREDSPWYPTARLFRQRIDGEWGSVFSRMTNELARFAGHEGWSWEAATVRVVPVENADAVRVFEEALALYRAGRLVEALAGYDRAIALKPDYPDAYNNRGVALCGLKRYDEALASYDRVIALRPDHPEAFNNRGNVLTELGRFAEALASFDAAIAVKRDYAETFNNRGNALQQLKRFDEALASYDRAIALRPHYAEAYYNRGIVLAGRDQFEEALACFDRAIALKPDYADAFNNRGNALHQMGSFDEALANYNTAIALKPGYAEAFYNRGIHHLRMGDYATGWADYEARWHAKDFPSKQLPIAARPWRGEDVSGRSIAIYIEQGLGDILQFARYLPLLAERGAKVTLVAPAMLHRLLRTLGGDIELAASIDASRAFDFSSALMSLPLRFGTEIHSIPRGIPYLHADAVLAAAWKARLGQRGFRIGIAWQGNPVGPADRGRSIPLREFFPLARVSGVRLISLQIHHGLEQLEGLPGDISIESLGEKFDGGPDAFLDTAAVMDNLDLVITSDTSIAHLAGALGRPVWISLKSMPDWRWLLHREDSPWYPTARLFRQERDGDWAGVFSRMEEGLRALVPAAPAAPMASALYGSQTPPGKGASPRAEKSFLQRLFTGFSGSPNKARKDKGSSRPAIRPAAENAPPDGSVPSAGDSAPANADLRVKPCKHGTLMYYANDGAMGRSLDLYGEYSEGEMGLFAQFLRPGMTIIDAGAHIGLHAVVFAKAVGPEGRVYAFEPEPTRYHALCGNLALNGIENVIASNEGLSARQSGSGEAGRVRAVDLLGLAACHAIKIDAVGMEREILEGAAKTLESRQPLLYIENGREKTVPALIQWLLSRGYRLYWHLPRLFNPKNHFGNAENVFGDGVLVNILGIPKSARSKITGMREIVSPEDSWQK